MATIELTPPNCFHKGPRYACELTIVSGIPCFLQCSHSSRMGKRNNARRSKQFV